LEKTINEDKMIFKAFAKINLGLRILERRSDGYHNIESVFCYLNWLDELSLLAADKFTFSCSDPSLPTGEDNLVVKAIRKVEQATHQPFHFSVHLTKNIPHGAGLGGGSSDAAGVIRFALMKWPELFTADQAQIIASELGSDINFFLSPESQIATDRGIVLRPINFQIPAWIVTVFPAVTVPTGWAYQQITPKSGYSETLDVLLSRLTDISDYSGSVVNDFDDPISSQKPEIQNIKDQLVTSGADYVSLSGSGSACFGLYKQKSQAESAFRMFRKNYPANLTPPGFKPK